MSDREIDIRCIDCRGEFASADFPHLQSCPGCGTRSVPADPRTDQDWTLSAWEWRTLLTLALAYAAAHRESDPKMIVPVEHLWTLIMGAPLADGDLVKAAESYVRDAEEKETRTARLSPHELRVLTIWASWCVESQREGAALFSDGDLTPVLTKLRPQAVQPIALTFADEITELREHFPSVEVRYSDGSGQ